MPGVTKSVLISEPKTWTSLAHGLSSFVTLTATGTQVLDTTSESSSTYSSSVTLTVSSTQGRCCCVCCAVGQRYSQSNNGCNQCDQSGIELNAPLCNSESADRSTIPPTTTTTATTMRSPSMTSNSSPTTTTTAASTTAAAGGTSNIEPATTASSNPSLESTIPKRQDFQESAELLERLASIDEATKYSYGFQVDDLFLECQYAGVTCTLSEFSQFYNPILGNCFVFNSGWNNQSQPMKSLKVGRRHGLHVTINIGQDEYVRESGDSAGVRLVTHPQRYMPFPEDEGITVSPGHATSIGLRQVVVKRKGEPYGNCTPPTEDHSSVNVYEELYPVHYSSTACTRTCYQRHLIARCHCADASYPTKGAALHTGEVAVCNSTNAKQEACKSDVMLLYRNNSLDCVCPEPCAVTSYSMEVSLGQWPSNVLKEDTIRDLRRRSTIPFLPEEYKDNLIKLEIFYEELNFEIISEKPKYPLESYASDVGGVLGLGLAFSMMTIAEFFEVFVDLAVLAGVRLSKCRRTRGDAEQPRAENNINIRPTNLKGRTNSVGCSPPSGTTSKK